MVNLSNSYAFALIFELIAVQQIPYHRALLARVWLESTSSPLGCQLWVTVPGITVKHRPRRITLGGRYGVRRAQRLIEAFYALLRSPQLFDCLLERGFVIAPEDAPNIASGSEK